MTYAVAANFLARNATWRYNRIKHSALVVEGRFILSIFDCTVDVHLFLQPKGERASLELYLTASLQDHWYSPTLQPVLKCAPQVILRKKLIVVVKQTCFQTRTNPCFRFGHFFVLRHQSPTEWIPQWLNTSDTSFATVVADNCSRQIEYLGN